MADTSPTGLAEPEVGSYFVATYPPFSVWSADAVARDAMPALQAAPNPATPLGLYLHIPFCRKRCHFCYFRVYTDKNASEIGRYLEVLGREWEMYTRQPAIAGRPLNFVYFGGGTPSFLSTSQLQGLVKNLTAVTPWNHAEEITFECEPGTLTEHKLKAIRKMGVTRLSLGVENFDDRILEINGRAHRSPEIETAYRFARGLHFPQINIDLIAGMLGETDDNWQRNIEKTIALEPDSITIYQMELPYNTTITKDLLQKTGQMVGTVAGWDTKRRWVREAFAALERAGYHIGSAYTAVRDPATTKFTYRDRLWQGADMAGLGVASFGHVNGVHVQNKDTWETYSEAIDRGELPLARAYRPTPDERMRRELVLQLKLGRLRPAYFADKYQVDILAQFAEQFAGLRAEGYLVQADADGVALSREGLLRVDSLLPRFFRPEHTNIRYT
jgi:coproporphyrinogen III oxidase-like Fe-S oxidoreductase